MLLLAIALGILLAVLACRALDRPSVRIPASLSLTVKD